MLGIGLWEIIAVLVAALIFVRPEDWPKLVRSLGRATGQLRAMAADIRKRAADLEEEEVKTYEAVDKMGSSSRAAPEEHPSADTSGGKEL